jgi:hypothetical protein
MAAHDERFELKPIATVQSSLTDLAAAPKQGHEGGPDAWLVFGPTVLDGLDGLGVRQPAAGCVQVVGSDVGAFSMTCMNNAPACTARRAKLGTWARCT